jgi:predicted MFS family arabinose efflux permease
VKASHDPALPFFIAGALGILNVLFLALFLPETNSLPKATHTFTLTKGLRNIRSAIADTGIRRIYLTSFLYLFGFSMFTSFYGIFLVHRFGFSEAEVGMSFAVVGTCVVLTQLIILRMLAKRYSEQSMLRYTIILVGASIGLSAFVPNAQLFLAFIPLVSSRTHSIANIPALISRSISADKQGAALGINASLLALANGLAPIVMGVGSGLWGVHMPFVTAALFILSAWCALFFPIKSFRAEDQVSLSRKP